MNRSQDSTRPFGAHACWLPRPAGSEVAALVPAVRAVVGVLDVVVTDDWVAVYGAPHQPLPDRALLESALVAPSPVTEPRWHRFRATYDGPDLRTLAESVGLSVDEVVSRHSAAEYTVAMLGFLPGFAYLAGLDPQLHWPRRDQPRARIEPDALAIGGPYTAVYPCASPGGWHLIGRVHEPCLFGPDGARLQSGDRVIFEPVA